MTIYDALSQEHGLLIYHDYLLDGNHELLAEMCLNQVIELKQIHVQSVLGSESESGSESGSKSGSYTNSFTRSRAWSWARSWSGSDSGSYASSYSCSYSRSVTGSG